MNHEQQTFVFGGTTDSISLPESRLSITERCRVWRLKNPRAMHDIEQECLSLADAGAKHISVRDVVGDVRRAKYRTTGAEFKFDNSFARPIADYLADKHPRLRGLFEQRQRPSEK